MNCSAQAEYVDGTRSMEAACCRATDERTRDRQAAVRYLRSAGAAPDAIERDYLRRLAAQLVLSKPA